MREAEPPHYRWNFFCAAVNGVLFWVTSAIFDASTVLPVFVGTLTANPIWVGVVSQLDGVCWPLPQLFAASRVLHLPRKLPFYRETMVVRVAAIGVVAALPFVVAPGHALLFAFIAVWAAYQLAGGLAGVAFMDVVGKTIPAAGRGALFTVRRFGGGALAVLAGAFVVTPILRRVPFPASYGTLFGVGAAFAAVALLVFSLAREPAGECLAERQSVAVAS